MERVGSCLPHSDVGGRDVKLRVQLPAIRPVLHRPLRCFMLYENDRCARAPDAVCDAIDALDYLSRLKDLPLAGGQGALYVDDEQSGGHSGGW